MRVMVIGGDGFCGWPTALRLSRQGHTVCIVDNLSRRQIGTELGVESLVSIATLTERIAAWSEIGGTPIQQYSIDVAENYQALTDLVAQVRPEAVIHFGEQRSVPYSMMDPSAGLFTVRNNLMGTTNLLEALVQTQTDAHVIHLGSIGVYGYETLGYEIPEGYQRVRHVDAAGNLGPEHETLHPFNPVSKYHLTKALDHLGLAYYAAKHGVRATDLCQGTVWGAETQETRRDPRLANRFDYDPIYGTVLHRFALQAALGKPISVYGTGEQTRAFIHMEDVLDCIEGALAAPPARGERVHVVNQIAECMSINKLAALFADLSDSEIRHMPSPRSEPAKNELEASNQGVIEFGVQPTLVSRANASDLIAFARRYATFADIDQLYPANALEHLVAAS
jgi:UDP-sulfoquinovose synthase